MVFICALFCVYLCFYCHGVAVGILPRIFTELGTDFHIVVFIRALFVLSVFIVAAKVSNLKG